MANKFEYTDVEINIENKNRNRKRKLEESSEYYGMKNMEYSKNIFSLNLIGLQMKLEVTNTVIIKEGKSVIKIKLQFAFIKISITLKTIKTNMHLAVRNYNEMGFTELYLINESNNKLINRTEKYSNIILNLEKDFNALNIDKYDFSNIFKDSFTEMYDQIKNFTTAIFQEFIEIIRNAYDNYTHILQEVKDNRHEVFNEIRNITKNEYIDFIYKMLFLVEEFNNQTYDFLINVEEEVGRIENFQIDLLYDLIDIVYEARKIFKDFNKNLFLAIEKGIKTFKFDFDDFIHEMMGDLLYLVDFLTINLNKNDILKNGMDDITRLELTTKLRNIRNIINVLVENLMTNIELDYKEEIDESNLNSIKVHSETKLKEYLEDLEKRSSDIIQDIKNKIEYINLYELYADNIDKIEEITKEVNNIFVSDLYNDTLEQIKRMGPEYLNENSCLTENREKLLNVVKLIDNNINNEVNEINNYISKYTKNYKNRKQYIIYYNYHNFRKSFIDSSLTNLRNKFIQLINDTVLISIQNTLTTNYNLGLEYLQDLVNVFKSLNVRDEYLQTSFWTKYSKFIKTYQTFLPNCYSDKSINVYKKYYNQIRNDILSHIRQKISKMKYYYFNISIYKEDFYFVNQLNKEIEYLVCNFEQYFSENYFDIQLASYIYSFTTENLNPINDKLYQQFESLRKQIEKLSDGTRNKNWGDYCYNKHSNHHWHYRSVKHTNNYIKVDSSFNQATNYIEAGTKQIIDKFIGGFFSFLDFYIYDIQTLFDGLYNYTENKLSSNEELNILAYQYNVILKNMSKIAEYDKQELYGNNISYFFQNAKIKLLDIKNDFFENYYLNNYSSYLEYPDEILQKIINLENELKFSYEIINKQINYMTNIKILRNKKENHYFIFKTKDFLDNLIQLKLQNKQIFDHYKEYRINFNLNLTSEKYFYDINENIYIEDTYNNISNIIQEYKNIVNNIDERINEDWILEKCIEVDNSDEIYETYQTDLSDITYAINLVCSTYKNKSSLNYSDYNFNVVKIRKAIYHIKYLYENLESLFDTFNFNLLMNSTKIKYKDEILNDKNIFNIYERTREKISEINKESEDLLEEYIDNYIEDINETIINELDFKQNFDIFKSILNFSEETFLLHVNNTINQSTSELLQILDEYNKTLIQQVNIFKKYDKYNFNSTIFQEETDNILKNILFDFEIIENNINNISYDYLINNTLKIRLEMLFDEKEKDYGNLVEDLNKLYEIKPFNLSFNIGKKTESIIKNLYEEMMFNFINDYIELIEKNRNIFSNSILEIVQLKKEEIINKYKEITSDFYKEIINHSTEYINKSYIEEYFHNYSICLNYSTNDLNETLIKDEYNYHEYTIYQEKLEICSQIKEDNYNLINIDILKLNIINKTIYELIENLLESKYDTYGISSTDYDGTEKEEQIKELKEYLDKLCNYLFNNKINYTNITEIHIDCINNNWYDDFSNITYFDNFGEEILKHFDVLLSQFNETINSLYIGGDFILNHLIENELINLNNSVNLSEKQIKVNLENFQDMAYFINYRYENKYNQIVKEELIRAFNVSFREFVENAIIGDIEDNILIYVFGKIDINVEYIKEKVKSENGYYIFLLNKTKELGITSKNALINLYDYINNRVNKTLIYQIEDYISDNIIYFYRENKYIFKDLFIYYFIENKNEIFGTNNIFNLESILPELILSRDFNKTLESISNELFQKILIDNINNSLQDQLNKIINPFSLSLKEEQTKIKYELEKVITVELYESMLLLSQMINNYTDLVNKQNNRFKFIVSNLPFKKFQLFSEIYLEPPLDKIKEYYEMIQNELLNKISEIVDQMRDTLTDIQIEYNITQQLNNMFNVLKNTYEYLVNYSQIFIDEIDDYDDILLLYTYLGESSYKIRELNRYLRSDERDILKLRKAFNLTNNETINKQLKRLAEHDINEHKKSKENNPQNINQDRNNKNYNKKERFNLGDKAFTKTSFLNQRKLSSHSNQGSIGISTIDKESQKFKQTLNSFNRTYLTGEYTKIKMNWLKEENKIKKYSVNSRRSIELSVLKLSSIITEDKMNSLEEILYLKHNQISSHVNNFLNEIPPLIDDFLYILGNSSEILDKTFNEANKKILFDYYFLKQQITGQIKEYKNANKNENVYINEKYYDLFKNEQIYQPVEIKLLNSTQKKINFIPSKTVSKYQKILKYSKYCVFNDSNSKYESIKNIFEEAKIHIQNKRRMTESETKKDIFHVKENEDEDMEVMFDLMKGKLEFEYEFSKEYYLDKLINELIPETMRQIPIFGPLKLFLDPKIFVGFYIKFGFETKLYDNIFNSDKIYWVTKDDEDEESKFSITVSGKGEVSLDVSVGIKTPSTGPYQISFLAGINGVLGSGEIGFSLEFNLEKLDIMVDSFYAIKACFISVFLMLKIKIDLKFYKMEFEFYIFNEPIFGLEKKWHHIVKKMIAEIIFMENNYLSNIIK